MIEAIKVKWELYKFKTLAKLSQQCHIRIHTSMFRWKKISFYYNFKHDFFHCFEFNPMPFNSIIPLCDGLLEVR